MDKVEAVFSWYGGIVEEAAEGKHGLIIIGDRKGAKYKAAERRDSREWMSCGWQMVGFEEMM